MNELIETIKRDEEFKSMPYNDSEGYPTIGYGTKLGISEEEATWLLEHRLNKVKDKVSLRLTHNGIYISNSVRKALYNMAYNLGVDGLFKFKKMLQALKNNDYELASKEAIDSKWATQVGSRAIEIADTIRKG